jgi:hypothetical protein
MRNSVMLFINEGREVHHHITVGISRYIKHSYIVRLNFESDFMRNLMLCLDVSNVWRDLNYRSHARHIDVWEWFGTEKTKSYVIKYGDLFNGSGQLEQYIKYLHRKYTLGE